mmetsp:Transcript_4209/g.9875  ORF Transcript_4209/g.9875 Transcript_4209/m.9875 type:complete len:223 (+) Transcript_4209:157-825(+)
MHIGATTQNGTVRAGIPSDAPHAVITPAAITLVAAAPPTARAALCALGLKNVATASEVKAALYPWSPETIASGSSPMQNAVSAPTADPVRAAAAETAPADKSPLVRMPFPTSIAESTANPARGLSTNVICETPVSGARTHSIMVGETSPDASVANSPDSPAALRSGRALAKTDSAMRLKESVNWGIVTDLPMETQAAEDAAPPSTAAATRLGEGTRNWPTAS